MSSTTSADLDPRRRHSMLVQVHAVFVSRPKYWPAVSELTSPQRERFSYSNRSACVPARVKMIEPSSRRW
jgi:hypothetical protein